MQIAQGGEVPLECYYDHLPEELRYKPESCQRFTVSAGKQRWFRIAVDKDEAVLLYVSAQRICTQKVCALQLVATRYVSCVA